MEFVDRKKEFARRCDAEQAVREYAVLGGVPRYWVLRENYDSLHDAIENLLLTSEGTLYDEPSKLLYDEMRDTVQASSILSFIGNGANIYYPNDVLAK